MKRAATNTPRPAVPEVSLLTSWRIVAREQIELDKPLPSIRQSLAAGIRLLDLYFVAQEEIPWYAHVAEVKTPSSDPHRFVGALNQKQLDRIASELQKSLSSCYKGVLVGRRPRFTAIATFFPNASIPPDDDVTHRRQEAVKAIVNTMYLARKLGCSCVEMVGGAGVVPTVKKPDDLGLHRKKRIEALALSIKEAYAADDPTEQGGPLLAVELEPGDAFLLNRLDLFRDLDRLVVGLGSKRRPYLNIDVAHAFIIGYTVEDLLRLKHCIAHYHISDHGGEAVLGGVHAADLPPNTYHGYRDYKPWLELAIELTNTRKTFSGVVAIEMEAYNELAVVLGAMSRIRYWLDEVAATMPQLSAQKRLTLSEGAFLAVDIGHSTENILSQQNGHVKVEKLVARLCRIVLDTGGSVMSFTGDGLIAFFDRQQFLDSSEAAQKAYESAQGIVREVVAIPSTSVRAALHWGKAHIPTSGELNDQIIGTDIVYTTRLCDWLSHAVEESVPSAPHLALLGAVQPFVNRHIAGSWTRWGKKQFKGLTKSVMLFFPQECKTHFVLPLGKNALKIRRRDGRTLRGRSGSV